MPALARTAGKWFGKISRFVSSVKSDIDRELKADEMKKMMEKHSKSAGLHEILEDVNSGVSDINQVAEEVTSETNQVAREIEESAPQAEPLNSSEGDADRAKDKYNSDDENYS